MGLCIGIKDNGNVYIGVNSHLYDNKATAYNKNNYKVWNVLNANNAIMACQGELRDSNIIRIIPDFISDYDVYKNRINYRFVLRNIAFRIKESLDKRLYTNYNNKIFKDLNSSYLFAYKDSLYEIDRDLSVSEIDDYVCKGSAASEAIGSLEATIGESPIVRIEKALRAASRTDTSINFPYIILDTRSQNFYIIEE